MKRIFKVRVIQNFTDAETLVDRKIGDEFDCSEERAKVLTGYMMGEIKFPLVEILVEVDAAPEEKTIKESEVASIELVDEVPEGEELKESITIVPDEEADKVEETEEVEETTEENKTEAEPKAKGAKRNSKAKEQE